ncbi:ATP-binding protein [Exiguobacterium antarcticum]|uniref:ATP-binding protein n=1 Tax=Exiguobacterium antarcticum TaxID=132920 RepID=UPI000285EDD9|nr:ATP-binding protein [Exiguobacterium antarcticum]AFS69851.1 Integral membrane sensor signal transduction histidine kinase [Exiguobacterium antarcticum B7]
MIIQWINRKIGRQLMASFYIVLATLMISSLIVYNYTDTKLQETRQKLEDIRDRSARAGALWEEWQDLQFNMRGYALIGDREIYQKMVDQRATIDEQTRWFEENAIYTQGKDYARSSRELYAYYFESILPLIESYVEAKETGTVDESFLRGTTLTSLPLGKELLASGRIKLDGAGNIDVLSEINKSELALGGYREFLEEWSETTSGQLEREIQTTQLIWLSNIVVLVGVLIFLIYPFIRRITAELLSLVKNSERLASGEDVSRVKIPDRTDEIGILAVSFNQMASSISDNKQHLLAKNEELQAQQEELQAQQEELQAQQQELEEALELTMRNEQHLQYRNDLTETLAAREALTAYPEIIEKLVTITDSEIGALVFVDEGAAYSIVTHGMTEELSEQLLGGDFSLLKRAESLKKAVHSSKQVASDHPLPYPYYMYETAVPILDPASEEIIAFIYLVRYRDQFTNEQMRDVMSFSRQLSLSLLRMRLFDEMNREKTKTERILDSIREAVIYIEPGKQEVFVNRPLYDLFPELQHGTTKTETLQGCLDTIRAVVDEPETFSRYVEGVLQGEVPKNSLQFSIRQQVVFIHFYVEPIEIDGMRKGTMLVLRDVTKETEMDRLKSELVSTVSHELRTPLSSIYGFTELMLNRDIDLSKQDRYLKTIHSETERLANLVNDFLDVQRMESGTQSYQKRPLDLRPLLEETTQFYAASTTKHTITFRSFNETGPWIEADEEKMKQLMNNLLNNAVKYSPSGGTIEVVLTADQHHVQFTVRDEGIGIPKTALAKLFEKFYRVDNSDSRKIGGTGLGLAICKEIVEGHDGEISVDSVERKGSLFTVKLPQMVTSHSAVSEMIDMSGK